MCGRFSLHASPASVRAVFDLDEVPVLEPRFNIAPSARVACVGRHEDRNLCRFVTWGLLPPWAGSDEPGRRLAQARSETAADKPSFREAWRRRRCLLPASGFYEWAPGAGLKDPWYVRPRDGDLLALAGLWERWTSAEDGRVEVGCTVLTKDADGDLAAVHPRMPVLLPRAAAAAWLEPGLTDADEVAALVRGAALGAADLELWRVGRDVNDARNDGPGLCAPLAPPRTADS
ncbi:MAG: SOS response-associated peptidase [Planctomycetota bacterium]